MPYLTVQFASAGPLIDLLVGVSQPREHALLKNSMPVPNPVQVRGLIDTGDSCTCIDPEIISSLSLAPTGTTTMLTPSTGIVPHECNQFDVGITLMHPELAFNFQALPVIEAKLKHQGFQALIGRDVLADCLLVYDGRHGSYTLAF